MYICYGTTEVLSSYEKEPWFASFSDRVAVIGVNPSNSMELNDVKDNNEPWPME